MANNEKVNGFLKYIMSGILLILILASFSWATIIYRDLNTKLDNHLSKLESKFDRKIDKLYDKVSETCERVSRIESKVIR